jgi:hypothetical protein
MRTFGELHDHLNVSGSALLSHRDEFVATSAGTAGSPEPTPGLDAFSSCVAGV